MSSDVKAAGRHFVATPSPATSPKTPSVKLPATRRPSTTAGRFERHLRDEQGDAAHMGSSPLAPDLADAVRQLVQLVGQVQGELPFHPEQDDGTGRRPHFFRLRWRLPEEGLPLTDLEARSDGRRVDLHLRTASFDVWQRMPQVLLQVDSLLREHGIAAGATTADLIALGELQ